MGLQYVKTRVEENTTLVINTGHPDWKGWGLESRTNLKIFIGVLIFVPGKKSNIIPLNLPLPHTVEARSCIPSEYQVQQADTQLGIIFTIPVKQIAAEITFPAVVSSGVW